MRVGNEKIEKKILLYILMPFCLLVAFQNCQPGQISASNGDEPEIFVQPEVVLPFKGYTDIEYKNGGWLGYGNASNWSHEYSLNISSLKIDAKLPENPNCVASRTLSPSEMMQIQNSYQQAEAKNLNSKDPRLLDGGTEVFYLVNKDPTTKEILKRTAVYFSEYTAPYGENVLYFAYPQELSSLMQSLVEQQDLLHMSCNDIAAHK